MVAEQKEKAYKEHDGDEEKEKDMKLGPSISQFTLERKEIQNKW